MKNILTFTFVICSVLTSIHSQDLHHSADYSVNKGGEFKRFRHYYKKYYSWGDHGFLFSKTDKGLTVQKFDNATMDEVDRAEIKNLFNPKKEQIEYMLQLENEVVVFISSRKKRPEILEAVRIPLDNLKAGERAIMISSPEKLVKNDGRNEYQVHAKYNFVKSKDNKLLAIEYGSMDSKTGQGGFYVAIFDRDLGMTHKETIPAGTNKDLLAMDRLIDKDHNYYFMGLTNVHGEVDGAYELLLYKIGGGWAHLYI